MNTHRGSNFRNITAALTLLIVVGMANADAEQGALEAQAARFAAMVAADTEALADTLADDLSYSHTTGWTETKSEFLSTVASGTLDYRSATPRDVEVRLYDDIAVITGLSDLELLVRGDPKSLTIRFLEVSRRTDAGWRLVAWQSVVFQAD